MRVDFIEADSELWRSVLADIDHDFYHFPEYVRLAARQEHGTAMAFVAQEGGNKLLLPFVLRPVDRLHGAAADVISPYGYPGPVARMSGGNDGAEPFVRAAITAFVVGLRERGAVSAFVRLHPILGVSVKTLSGIGCTIQHGETIFIDLSLSTEELWRQTRSGHRYEISRARKDGQSAEIDSEWLEFDSFCEIYLETMGRVGADPMYFFSREYFLGLRRALGNRLHLCVVRIQGEVACAGLFTEVCGVVQYHLSGTRERFVSSFPTKIMLDFVRSWAKERGNRIFHLGGGVGGHQDSLFNFKSGFSKLRSPFYTWRIIIDETNYGRLKESWASRSGRLPDGPEGFFPAYRKPFQLP
jgi:hypothetical protein